MRVLGVVEVSLDDVAHVVTPERQTALMVRPDVGDVLILCHVKSVERLRVVRLPNDRVITKWRRDWFRCWVSVRHNSSLITKTLYLL